MRFACGHHGIHCERVSLDLPIARAGVEATRRCLSHTIHGFLVESDFLLYYNLIVAINMASQPDSTTQPQATMITRLTYTIAGGSDHSHRYAPENILVDMPKDQASRWTGVNEGPSVKQWLLLRLDSLSVVGEASLVGLLRSSRH
jgi:Muskelin N-terminus